MKILLDESLPRKLKFDFKPEYEIWTVKEKKWLGVKNGALLKLLIEDNFDFFVTVDRNLQYQQNLERLPVTIFVLCAKDNRRETLKKLIPQIYSRIEDGNMENVIEIF